MSTKITLEQWKVFVGIVEHGGSAQAAEFMHKSQSAISHSLKKMESIMGRELFRVEGRKLILTPLGEILLPKAKMLLGEAVKTESFGNQYREGMVNEISIAVDALVPVGLIPEAFEELNAAYPGVSIRVLETSLSGAKQQLEEGNAHIGVASTLPSNYIIEPFMSVSLICVAASDHPLCRQSHVDHEILKDYIQIVIRDSGQQAMDSGWLGSPKRWTVSHISTSLYLVLQKKGFAWLPEHCISQHVKDKRLTILPLDFGGKRFVHLHMAISEKYIQYPEINRLAAILTKRSAQFSLPKPHASTIDTL